MAFVQLSGSFYLPSTLIICCLVHALSKRRAVIGGVVNFIIKHILGIKRIFPCSFGNKRMHLLTHVYGITVDSLLICYNRAMVSGYAIPCSMARLSSFLFLLSLNECLHLPSFFMSLFFFLPPPPLPLSSMCLVWEGVHSWRCDDPQWPGGRYQKTKGSYGREETAGKAEQGGKVFCDGSAAVV